MGDRISRAGAQRLALFIISAATLFAAATPVATARTHHRRHTTRHVHHHRRTKHHRRSTPPPQCANANASATAGSLDAMRAAVVCLINQQRSRRGLPTLTVSPQLNNSAQGWTSVMVATGNFTHGPGTAFASRISAAGYNWQDAGENIATGYPTPSAVVNAWMASPDHCRNILDPSFRNVGTGEVAASVGSASDQPATWTQDFGLLASQSPLSHNTRPQSGCPS